MFVTEHLDRATEPLFSFEIIPPPRGRSAKVILDIVEQVMPYRPPFIDVTSHSAEAVYEELPDSTIRRRVRKKRPGTISLCGIIQNRYNVDTVPHLLCRGFSREETEDTIIELNFLGLHNVLAIRGDETNYLMPARSDFSVNAYANELVKQLNNLKKGEYLEKLDNTDPVDLCIGVGGHPEKHVESPNRKTDIRHLKQKVDAGADYIVSQMFFDNRYYNRFQRECRQAGINAPMIPGIKIISSVRQLTTLPKNFHVTIPDELVDEIHSSPKHVREIGIRWGVNQCRKLLAGGVRCIHFYVMNDAKAVTQVIDRL
jgi:methylenetetrahydrofolate reductase (NADPH)